MLLCLSAVGQVTREVEVTKQYAPKLPPAQKLDIPTNRVDTVAKALTGEKTAKTVLLIFCGVSALIKHTSIG